MAILSKVPKPLKAALAAIITASGVGGGVYVAEEAHQESLKTEYLQTVAADTETSQAVKLAMVMGSYWESSFRHIGTPYIDKLGKGQPWTVCNGVTGKGVVPGKYYTPADCYRLEKPRYLGYEQYLAKVPNYRTASPLQQASFMDFTHNFNTSVFASSTMYKKLVAGDVVGACRENPKWVNGTVNGKKVPLPGLVNRRAASAELCEEGL